MLFDDGSPRSRRLWPSLFVIVRRAADPPCLAGERRLRGVDAVQWTPRVAEIGGLTSRRNRSAGTILWWADAAQVDGLGAAWRMNKKHHVVAVMPLRRSGVAAAGRPAAPGSGAAGPSFRAPARGRPAPAAGCRAVSVYLVVLPSGAPSAPRSKQVPEPLAPSLVRPPPRRTGRTPGARRGTKGCGKHSALNGGMGNLAGIRYSPSGQHHLTH